MKKRLLIALVAIMAMLGLGLLTIPSASAAETKSIIGKTAKWKITGRGTMVPMNQEAAELDQRMNVAPPPITSGARYRFLFGSNNIERMLCIKDYTVTGDSVWVPKWAASLWNSAGPHFGMVWDDMNGNGSAGESNCISYDDTQNIKVYSYSGPESNGCGEVSVIYNGQQWITSAIIQLNTTGRLRSCRYTQVLRQNIIVGAVGQVLGLRYFNDGFTQSVMNTDLAIAETIAQPMAADKTQLGVKYQYS